MGIEYYGFAFFIFLLICALAFLFRYLFADTKRQQKLLDEKEGKLLRLYQTVEELMDDFHDSVAEAKADMEKMVRKINAGLESANKTETQEQEIKSEPKKQKVQRVPNTKAPKAPEAEFKQVMRSAEEEVDEGTATTVAQLATGLTARIMELSEQKMSDAQIARELGITQSEVGLVLGINKKR